MAYPAGAEALRADAEQAGIAIYIHAPYVLNVASTNNRIRIPSRQQLQKQLTMAACFGAAGVIVHGGHVLATDDPQVGFDNWRKAVDGLTIEVPLLIENTAGAPTRWLARWNDWADCGRRSRGRPMLTGSDSAWTPAMPMPAAMSCPG